MTTSEISTVTYPSALFSLERDESFPYERLAYNLLDIAIEALNAKGLPERVMVDFTTTPETTPWSINARVRCDLDPTGVPIAFRFSTPEFVPALAYVYCHSFGTKLVEVGVTEIRESLQRFVEGANVGVREYKQHGLAPAVRACYEHFGLTILDLEKTGNEYDLLTKVIAFHEVGHAYAMHLSSAEKVDAVRRRGFEIVADLLAIEWFYNKMVRNTPDDDGYREQRGFTSYSESIFSNCMSVKNTQTALLCFMAIAGAQRNGGTLTLEGGESHPHGLQRHLLQHVHFATLVESNFKHVLSTEQLAALSSGWDNIFGSLVAAGVIPIADLGTFLDPRDCDTVEAAANAIEDMNIQELQPIVPVLNDMREMMTMMSEKARRELGWRGNFGKG